MDINALPHPPTTVAHARPTAEVRVRTGAALFVAAAIVSGHALARCLHRTSRLKRQTDELARLSRTDPLTGLPNRRDLEERLAAAVSAARRHGQPLSVLFVDIDGFKRVNDKLGYEAGDEVLRVVGERVRSTLRAEDVVGRWGGEEFLALLANTDLAGAMRVAERARAGVACAVIPADDSEVSVTVSVGCVSAIADPAELVRQAAGALRRAKRTGKNRVVAADSSDG